MPAVMFGLVVMAVLGVASLRVSSDEQRSVQAFRESSSALFAAEAGLRKTIGAWPTSVATMSSGDSVDLGWLALSNGTTYRAVIHRVDFAATLPVYSIVVQGRGRGVQGGQRLLQAVIAAQPLYKYAVYALQNITMGSNQIVDGFNSGTGTYNALTAEHTADLVALGNITLGPTTVKGAVTAGGTATNTTLVTQSVIDGATNIPTYSTVNCPSTGYTAASSIPSGTGISYNQSTGQLSLTSTANLILTGTQYYFSSISITGQAKLTVSPGTGHVDMFIGNGLNIAGGGIANTAGKADQLTVSACGNPTSPSTWHLTGGTDAYYSLYAPNHDVQIGGTSDMYGAVVGQNVTFNGTGRMHYDAALLNNSATTLVLVPGSWAELAQQ